MGSEAKIESIKLKDGPDGVWVDRTISAYTIFGGCAAESYTCSSTMCKRARDSESLPRPMVFLQDKKQIFQLFTNPCPLLDLLSWNQ